MRYRRLIANIGGSLLTRSVNLLATVFMVPALVSGLSAADYGVVAIILSATVIFSYADLGLGLGVVNKVAGAGDDISEAKAAVSRVWIFLTGAAFIISGVGLTVLYALAYSKPPAIPHSPNDFLAWTVGLISISCGLPTALSQRLLFAEQRIVEAGLWAASGKILSVIFIYLSNFYHADLPVYVFGLLGIPAIFGWLNTIWFFWIQKSPLRPNFRLFNARDLFSDIGTSIQFSLLQFAVYAETGVDNLIIGSIYGSSSVPHYDLLGRLFGYVSAFVSIGAFPLWPALRKAVTDGEEKWFYRTQHGAYLLCGFFVTPGLIGLIFFHARIIEIWTGKIYHADYVLAFWMATLALMTSFTMIQTMGLNARHVILRQTQVQIIAVPVLLLLKFFSFAYISLSAGVAVVCFISLARMGYYANAFRSLPVSPKAATA